LLERAHFGLGWGRKSIDSAPVAIRMGAGRHTVVQQQAKQLHVALQDDMGKGKDHILLKLDI